MGNGSFRSNLYKNWKCSSIIHLSTATQSIYFYSMGSEREWSTEREEREKPPSSPAWCDGYTPGSLLSGPCRPSETWSRGWPDTSWSPATACSTAPGLPLLRVRKPSLSGNVFSVKNATSKDLRLMHTWKMWFTKKKHTHELTSWSSSWERAFFPVVLMSRDIQLHHMIFTRVNSVNTLHACALRTPSTTIQPTLERVSWHSRE